ncbi:MAG: TolC family outer membrane protein, partial [Proteobacteria bacterium]|nr:TolC family outer membrane protein [Pseudomonadota bacterium]
MSAWRFSLIACSSLAAATAAHADTLIGAMTDAFHNNPTLDQARLAVRAAREDRIQARAGYLPQVSLNGSYGYQDYTVRTPSPFFGTITNHQQLHPETETAQITQQVFTGGRLAGQTQLAHAGVDSARNALRSTEQQVMLAAADAYLSVRRDETIVMLREQDVQALTTQLAGTQRRLDVGEVSRTDVAQVQTRLAGANSALAQARADLDRSRAQYTAVVGYEPHDLQPPTMPALPQTLEEAVRIAQTSHPDLLQARSDVQAARARTTIERSALSPQVSLQGRYDHFNQSNLVNQERDGTSATVNLSVPLYEGGYYSARVRQSRINEARADAHVEEQRRQIVANATSAWSDYAAYHGVLAAANEQVAAAREALNGAERERGLGLRSTLDVLNAEQEFRDAEINLARAEAAAALSAYTLLADTGMLSIETLTPH